LTWGRYIWKGDGAARTFCSESNSDIKGLEIESEQGVELVLVVKVRMSETGGDGRLKGGEILIVGGVETFFLHKLPQPFDEVQVGRIWGEK